MHRLARYALPLLVFTLGLGAGAWFSSSRGAADSNAGAGPRSAENADVASASAAKNARAFSSDEEMLTAIMSAAAEEEPLLRAHRLHDLLGRLGAAELATLFGRTVGVEDRERRATVLGALLARWTVLDPAGAAAAVRPYRDRFRALARRDYGSADTAVNEAWTQARPEAALAEAMAAPDAPWARETAWGAIRTLAEGEPAQQLAMLARLPACGLRDQLCESAIQSLAEKDTAAAEAHLDLLRDPRQRAGVQAEILGQLAARDAPAALARFAALASGLDAGTQGTRLVSTVLRAAAKKDPAAALAAAEGVPDELHTQALGAALVGWASEHPAEALAWATAHGVNVAEAKASSFFGNDHMSGSSPLVDTAFESDRAKTLAWLRTQPASAERDAMLREGMFAGTTEQRLEIYAELTPQGRAGGAGYVIQSLYREDPQRAETWIKALPTGAARAAAVRTLTFQQIENAPERGDTLAEARPAGPDRDAALSAIAGTFLYRDASRALDFARRIGGAAEREELFERVAQSWLYRDDSAARAWITNAPEFSPEQKRVLLRQFDER